MAEGHPVHNVVVQATEERATAVVLHGNGMCADFYRPFAERLAAGGITSTLVTYPGYDGTAPLDPVGWPSLMAVIEPFVRNHLSGRNVLIGHSLGGHVAAQVAARMGDALDRLVLLEPAILPFDWMTRKASEIYRSKVVDAERSFKNQGPGYLRIHDPERFPASAYALAARCRKTTDPATERTLVSEPEVMLPFPFKRVTQPTLLVRGASSGNLMWAAQYLLAWRFPRAETFLLPDAGHWMVNEQDDALAEAVLDFALR